MAESGGIQAEVGVGLLLPGTSAESANEFERALTALLSPTAMCQELDALSAKIFGNLQVGKSEDCELAGWDEAHCRAGEDEEDEDKIAVDLHKTNIVDQYVPGEVAKLLLQLVLCLACILQQIEASSKAH